QHIKGKDNAGADFLSRCMFISKTDTYSGLNKILDAKKIAKASEVADLIQGVSKRELTTNIVNKYKVYTDKRNRIAIPESIENEFLLNAHVTLAHPGVTRLAKTISSGFMIQGLFGKVKRLTSSCIKCQINKSGNVKYGELKGYITATKPFEKIAVDLLGPISLNEFETENDKDQVMILVVIDIFSKWSETYLLRNISSKEILRKLDEDWIKKWGKPKALLSDQGTQFISHEFTDYLALNDIKHIISSTYNPTGNSVVERVNQVIGNGLRCLKGIKIQAAIKRINHALQTSYHQTLNATPHEVVFRRHPFNPLVTYDLQTKQLVARKRKQALKDLKSRNKRRIKIRYKRNQKVFVKNPTPAKMDQRWSGPFPISKVCTFKNYVVVKTPEGHSRINLKRLKPFNTGEHVMK
ncbi:hypothetical protein NGRA_3410, partial [Nosema granulosis]